MTGYNGPSDPKLQAIAEAERERHRASRNGGGHPKFPSLVKEVDGIEFAGRYYARNVDGKLVEVTTGEELNIQDIFPPANNPEVFVPLWTTSRLSKWANQEIPLRRWFLSDWIVRGQCTGLYGLAGVLKTDFVLQMMIAGGLRAPFCGIPIDEPCVTLGLFCEDDDTEIARRAGRLAAFYGRSLDELGNCHYASLVGVQMTELCRWNYTIDQMEPTSAFKTLEEQLGDLKPKLTILDTAPDFFGGHENDRRHVSQFFRMLDGAGQRHDTAIVFSAHPSVRGANSGRLDGGSTGWEGKVRARLTLHDPGDDDDADTEAEDERRSRIARNPSDKRILTRVKCNYARPGEQIALVLRNGGFFPEAIDPETAPLRGHMRDLAVDAKFLELISKTKATGIWVNDAFNVPNRYAPAVFSRHPDHGSFTKQEFERAMHRLLGKGRIRLETAGSKSHPHAEFVVTQGVISQ